MSGNIKNNRINWKGSVYSFPMLAVTCSCSAETLKFLNVNSILNVLGSDKSAKFAVSVSLKWKKNVFLHVVN